MLCVQIVCLCVCCACVCLAVVSLGAVCVVVCGCAVGVSDWLCVGGLYMGAVCG